MKIAVFLHGTTIMHRSAIGKSREERVQQVQQKEDSIHDYASYVPIGKAPEKLRTWSKQGVEIIYISSHKRPEHVEQDQTVLNTYHFPHGQVVFREYGETYQDVIERILPDILIEDDCESIGGEQEMMYPHLRPEIQARIRAIIVKEFEGIDHLPDDIGMLLRKS
ncbi:MAG TPA: hypothetical protein VFA41_22185 [Ktedonobacteraceae bacterium]|jgi:hypothetical protein|nr:hypothetical protein [Ktedonobacteraceae bacterium]